LAVGDWEVVGLPLGMKYSSFSLAVASGFPVAGCVFDFGAGERDLGFVRSLSVDGANGEDWADSLVEDDDNLSGDCRLIPAPPHMTLAVFDVVNEDIMGFKALFNIPGGPSSWDDPVVLAAGAGPFFDMAMIDGFPALAYYSTSSNTLRYVIFF
jgi:hypothetical protein